MAASAIFTTPPEDVLERFTTWPVKGLERSAEAPDWKRLRMKNPKDGWTHRPTRDPVTGQKVAYDIEDVFGTREEGARWHTHFLPLYPIGTPAEVIMRDYIMDIDWAPLYAQTCMSWGVTDLKVNPMAYWKCVQSFGRDIWNCVRYGVPELVENARIDDKMQAFLIHNPHRPASLKDDLLAAMKGVGTEQEQFWYKIAIEGIFL